MYQLITPKKMMVRKAITRFPRKKVTCKWISQRLFLVIAFHITFSRDTELDCTQHRGFVGGSDGKDSVCNAGDLAWTPGLGRSPEEGMATHSSISAWRVPMDRGDWWATVHGVAESDTTDRPSTARHSTYSTLVEG